MPQPETNRTQRGFTLLEVLVALAIIAFGLTALFTTVNQTVRTSSYLRERTLAQWVALNRIVEVRLTNQKPADDTSSGELEYAGEQWRWEVEATETPVDGIIRLDARAAPASAAKDTWTGQATGFLSINTTTGLAAAIAQPSNAGQNWLQGGGGGGGGGRGGGNNPPAAAPPPAGGT